MASFEFIKSLHSSTFILLATNVVTLLIVLLVYSENNKLKTDVLISRSQLMTHNEKNDLECNVPLKLADARLKLFHGYDKRYENAVDPGWAKDGKKLNRIFNLK